MVFLPEVREFITRHTAYNKHLDAKMVTRTPARGAVPGVWPGGGFWGHRAPLLRRRVVRECLLERARSETFRADAIRRDARFVTLALELAWRALGSGVALRSSSSSLSGFGCATQHERLQPPGWASSHPAICICRAVPGRTDASGEDCCRLA